MQRCQACGGWMPTATSCPNCDLQVPTARPWLKSLGVTLGSAAVGLTLAACYGAPTMLRQCEEGACPTNPNATDDLCEHLYASDNPNLLADPNCVGWRRAACDTWTEKSPELDCDGLPPL